MGGEIEVTVNDFYYKYINNDNEFKRLLTKAKEEKTIEKEGLFDLVIKLKQTYNEISYNKYLENLVGFVKINGIE
ncbi:hypothetical protein ACFL1H_04495, partial [Nanoarchaeota archaeon]